MGGDRLKTNYFLDTEFIELPYTIRLISIGIKCEDGREYYAISSDFEERLASDWVKENVIAKLGDQKRKSIIQIRGEILEFIKGTIPEFWGYYSAYDWVVFCWIFGTMMQLPENFPMYCGDLKQLLDQAGINKIADPEGEHDALVDANWNMKLYNHICENWQE